MNRVYEDKTPQGQDIDALLSTFFKAQVPSPWPAFRPPRKEKVQPFRPAAEERPWLALTSRWALALSVALLMLCGWLLSGSMSGPSRPRIDLNGGDAHRDKNKLPLPDFRPDAPSKQPGKVRSSVNFEQGDKEQSIRIDVQELPSNK